MLVIRLARTGKKHQAYFRIVVADSRRAVTAKFIEILGNYDPHAKKLTIDKEKAEKYMKNGAQPSNAVAKLFVKEGLELPKWVKITEKKRNPKKEVEVKEAPVENSEPAESAEKAEVAEEAPAESGEQAESVEEKTEEVAEEATEEAAPEEEKAEEAVTEPAESGELAEATEAEENTEAGESTENSEPVESTEDAATE